MSAGTLSGAQTPLVTAALLAVAVAIALGLADAGRVATTAHRLGEHAVRPVPSPPGRQTRGPPHGGRPPGDPAGHEGRGLAARR